MCIWCKAVRRSVCPTSTVVKISVEFSVKFYYDCMWSLQGFSSLKMTFVFLYLFNFVIVPMYLSIPASI